MENVVGAAAGARFVRGPITWHLYLLVGFFQFVLSIQGNILPFLQSELDLSYRTVGLHPSAVGVAAILVGLFGDNFIRRFGRRRMLIASTCGLAAGALLLCVAPAAPVSIASCFLLGLLGSFVPAVVFATLADIHGERRAVAFSEARPWPMPSPSPRRC